MGRNDRLGLPADDLLDGEIVLTFFAGFLVIRACAGRVRGVEVNFVVLAGGL